MRKSVVTTLMAAGLVGVGANVSAAANPFSDIPAGHWAYNSVAKLASAGVIEGYGDGTYRGDRQITRYEMAQMIAKAMAKNPTGASKAELDRLSAEFRDELDALGVRVAELEKYNDKVVWQGKIEYTYKSHRTDNIYNNGKTRVNQDDWLFRFDPIVYVNKNWRIFSRIDAHVDLSRDQSNSFSLERAWAQGDYGDFQVKFGRPYFYTNEDGLLWDTEYAGGEITYGKSSDGLRATIYGGRLRSGNVGGSIRNAGAWNGRQDGVGAARWTQATGWFNHNREDPSSFWAINLQYDPGAKGIFGGAGYYNIKDDDLKTYLYNNSGNSNKAQIVSVNAGYRLGKAQIWGSFAKNSKADHENNSWQALMKYGDIYAGGNHGTKRGQWAVWAGYKKYGSNTSFSGVNWDDVYAGTKGAVVGASWAPMDRVVVLAKYFKGKYIKGPGNVQRLFARVEIFF